jgi:hypothetical protein
MRIRRPDKWLSPVGGTGAVKHGILSVNQPDKINPALENAGLLA